MKYIGVQAMFSACRSSYSAFTILTKEQYVTMLSELSTQKFDIDSRKINSLIAEQAQNEQRSQFLDAMMRVIYARQVEKQALGEGDTDAITNPNTRETQILRLVQTTITRFGTLAVISFLVGILVSLYRYNVKLAAFYLARADLFILLGNEIKPSDVKAFASSFTPQLDFGKTPSTPIEQVVEMVRAVRGLDKQTD
jgi:hypothetical protein